MADCCPIEHSRRVTNPCGVVDCPLHYTHQAESGCLLRAMSNLESVPERVAFLTERGLSTPARIARQFNELGIAVKDFEDLPANSSPAGCCPNCGYPKPCKSKSLCHERYDATDGLSLALGASMSRSQIWRAVVDKKDGFLPRKTAATLRELVSA